jgi:hypothetical protein
MTRTALATATICAFALLPAATATATTAGDLPGEEFHVTLSGSQIPGGGDPKGSGLAKLLVNPEGNELCWQVDWKDLSGQVTAMHVHKGPAGGTGPHAVDLLDGASFDGASGSADACTTPHNHKMDGGGMAGGHSIFNAHTEPGGGNVLQEIIDNPSNFYVNLHTTAYKDGAIRGQIG